MYRPIGKPNILAILEDNASKFGSKPLFHFAEAEQLFETITYSDFFRQVNYYGHRLRLSLGKAVGQRVVILYPPGITYNCAFFSCLVADAIPVPAYPPLSGSVDRIKSIIKDCKPAILLADQHMVEKIKESNAFFDGLNLEPSACISLAELPTAEVNGGQTLQKNRRSQNIAFLQYTSGSTGNPKGVMLTHENLIANALGMQKSLGYTSEAEMVSWLPPYHDMGLIGCMITPSLIGMTTTMMTPLTFVKKPVRWLRAISDIISTDFISSGGPNFSFELCIDKVDLDHEKPLNLDNWKVAFCGSEPIRVETLMKFTKKFSVCGFKSSSFIPVYGLAEGTLMVTGHRNSHPPTINSFYREPFEQNEIIVSRSDGEYSDNQLQSVVSCGPVIPLHEVAIVNSRTREVCQANEIGEVWFKGASVAKGYYGKPTDATFRAYTTEGAGPYLRTGDKGFLYENQLYIAGRLKDCIIINGKNHYPQDIEITISKAHFSLRRNCTVLFSVVETDGNVQLVAVQELRRDQSETAFYTTIMENIRTDVLAQHGLFLNDILLVKQASIPKTSSGKPQRNKTKLLYLDNQLHTLNPKL